MPFIRDYAYSTTGATATTTITCGVPVSVENDILVAMISSDGSIVNTANATVTGAGWFFLGGYGANGTNDAGFHVYARYAPASPPIDYTFGGWTSETLNAMIISVGDAFQTGTANPTTAFENITASTATANWTAVRRAFPAIDTSANDSLILYFGAGDGTGSTGIPTFIEGLSNHQLIGKDGGAHCDGAGWTFKRAAGTLATNTNYVLVDGNATPTNYLAQMVVRPPTGGITVRPPYIVQDNSKLIYMGTGNANVTGYGTVTATGANSTDFPTATLTLNGRPVVASGTTYTATDQGVNTFHSGINILGVTTSGSWASNQTTTPAMTDLAGFNLLFHVSPAVPASLQSIDSVKLSGASGFAIGLGSTAGNCKVWQCHGAGTPWGNSRWVPVVINTDATAGVIGQAGTFNANSITKIGLFLSCKGIANSMTVASIWKMDVTIAAGGDANRPFGIQDTVDIFATSKERRSVILQGANQLYVVQELQYGNGGTDPTYVVLDNAVFEFPTQYNKAAGLVNYNSVDNKVGVSFYPGASDTVSLRNVTFTSANKYEWGFNASSGAANVDTEGMRVIGAGIITMAANVPMVDCGFNKCDEIAAAGASFTGVAFSETTSTVGAVSITSATIAGLQTELNKLTNCVFTSNTTGAGLVIKYTGSEAGPFTLDLSTGTFTGNTFDIKWSPTTAKTLTVNVVGTANPTTITATLGSASISNPKTVTLTGLIADSEVRAYLGTDPATSTEIGGIESSTTSFQFTQNFSGQAGYIQIFHVDYQPVFLSVTYSSSNESIPIQQVKDRQYSRGSVSIPG